MTRVTLKPVQWHTWWKFHVSHPNVYIVTRGENDRCHVKLCTVGHVSKKTTITARFVQCDRFRKRDVGQKHLYSARRVENEKGHIWHVSHCTQCDTCRKRKVENINLYSATRVEKETSLIKNCTVPHVSQMKQVTSKFKIQKDTGHSQHLSLQKLYSMPFVISERCQTNIYVRRFSRKFLQYDTCDINVQHETCNFRHVSNHKS